MMKKTAFSLVSLGCARALTDSENMVDDLRKVGFELVAEGSGESITVLNTCSFIDAAVKETEENIRTLSKRKQHGDLKHLVVVGCYPSRYKKDVLQSQFPDVDLWLTTKEESKIKDALSELVFQKRFQPNDHASYVKLTPSHFSYLKISEGCNNWCTFCTIPKIRGEHTSKPLEVVLEDAKKQLAFGVKELNIIAEDTTAWGEDIYGKPSFPLLLEELAKLPVPWLRVMYVFPSRVDDTLISVMKKYPNICHYMDIPIQHVSSPILSAMNRRHDKAFLEKLIVGMKKEIPDLALRTTFILGFPGETEEHVDELIDFIDRHPFHQLGCFGYSEERETRAARFADKVDAPTIQSRIHRVMKAQQAIFNRISTPMIGSTMPVLYEGNGIGRTQYQAPDVDGVVQICSEKELISGQFYPAKITGVSDYDWIAEVN